MIIIKCLLNIFYYTVPMHDAKLVAIDFHCLLETQGHFLKSKEPFQEPQNLVMRS